MKRIGQAWHCVAAALVSMALLTPPARALERVPLHIAIPGADLLLEQRGMPFAAGDAEIRAWIERSARIVSQYYGYFPARRVTLRLLSIDGGAVQNGHTQATPAAVIDITLGHAVTADALLHDWVLVHEMIHLALPDVGRTHNWLPEGISTYVESVARVQAGNMTEVDLWRDFVMRMPKGLPAPGDRGLDGTPSWGRTYWGGALFCLLADVKIREVTQGRTGLQDALRAIGRGGGISVDDSIDRVFAVGDAATRTTVLEDLYASMKNDPLAPDLPALWQRLGVRSEGSSLTFDDSAPLAWVRRGITAPSANPDRPPR